MPRGALASACFSCRLQPARAGGAARRRYATAVPSSLTIWPGIARRVTPFGGWTKTFTDPRLCAAIVDRLTFGGTILETGTDSYRLAQATKQRTG